jgi:outer membrane protein TolC
MNSISTGVLLLAAMSLAPARLGAEAWTLASYKAEVLRTSYDVKKAAEDAEMYRGQYVSDLAAFWLPSVLIGAADSPYASANSPKWRFEKGDVTAGVTARLNLYNNFKDKLAADASRVSSKVYEHRLWQERQRVALAAMQHYYGVLRKKRLLEVVRNSLVSYQQQYEKVALYYKEGMKSYSDLLKSELNVRSSQLSEASSIEDYRNSVMDLNLAVYRQPEEEAVLSDDVSVSTEVSAAAAGDVAFALEHRPELRVLRLETQRAGYTSRKAALERMPDLSMDAYYDRRGLGAWGKPSAGSVNPAYYLNLSLSLSLGPATFAENQSAFEARTGLERARRALYEAELQVRRDVVSSGLALDTALKRYEVSTLKSGISKASLEIVNTRYTEGRSGIVELADAQRDDLQAGSDLANALYDLLLARAGYHRALGRQLW